MEAGAKAGGTSSGRGGRSGSNVGNGRSGRSGYSGGDGGTSSVNNKLGRTLILGLAANTLAETLLSPLVFLKSIPRAKRELVRQGMPEVENERHCCPREADPDLIGRMAWDYRVRSKDPERAGLRDPLHWELSQRLDISASTDTRFYSE